MSILKHAINAGIPSLSAAPRTGRHCLGHLAHGIASGRHWGTEPYLYAEQCGKHITGAVSAHPPSGCACVFLYELGCWNISSCIIWGFISAVVCCFFLTCITSTFYCLVTPMGGNYEIYFLCKWSSTLYYYLSKDLNPLKNDVFHTTVYKDSTPSSQR